MFKTIVGASLAALLVSQAAVASVQLRVQTSTQSGGFSFQYMNKHWVPKLPKMTNGEVSIEFLPIKSVVPATQTPEAVGAQVLSGDLTSIEYFSGRNPAFAIMGNLIAGYERPEQEQTFCKSGGGARILQHLWNETLPGQIHVVGCGSSSREALVSKVPIRSVDDLKGKKIRSPEGMAAAVFRAAGATPVNIPFADLFTSLQKGIVDAADASAYANNDRNGFNRIARYPIYPGIHSMPVHQFTINQNIWDSLSPQAQAGLTKWFYAAYADLARALRQKDLALVKRDKKDPAMHVVDWPQKQRDRFRLIAKKVWERTASKSPEAQKALRANLSFMRREGILN